MINPTNTIFLLTDPFDQQMFELRFWRKVNRIDDEDSCWDWTGSTTGSGYGEITVRKPVIMIASRASWELANGPIPAGLEICHSCDRPSCVRPSHLSAETHAVNMADMYAKGRRLPTSLKGEAHPLAKLDPPTVLLIRRLRADGKLLREIASETGLGKSTVSRIINEDPRGGWAHVKEAA